MLTGIAYIAFLFLVVRFLVSFINILYSPVLKHQKMAGTPKVSVLIPARNEEKTIVQLLNDLIQQDYRNMEVIVYNDQSTDRTGEIAESFVANDKRFRVIHSVGLPEGWLGKNHACHQLAGEASGEYFLFLDADVRGNRNFIESALAQMEKHQLALLSVFPRQEMQTPGEKMIVPVMNSILLSLLPMILTRISPRPSLAAANGQFMLFRAKTYRKVLPHKKVKNLLVEDILISRLYKSNHLRIQCMTGNETIRCRMYQNLKEALHGLSRSVAEFFGGSHWVAFLYWLTGTIGIFAIISGLSAIFSYIALALMAGTIVCVSVASRQPVWQNLLYAIPRQLFLGIIIFISYKNKKLKRTQWKGRNINNSSIT
ncbi:MAG: glycosyltransferase [Mariniphaga sp.]|nr:glycosyltransferase [Mariniphaga sp.]